MSTPRTLHSDDRDRLFADWAQTVVFRQIVAAYDPTSGETAEDVTDSELSAIPGPAVSSPVANTAHLAAAVDRTFLVRSEDLPAGASLVASRIVHAGQEYALLGVDQSAMTGILVLNARRLD